MIDVLNYPSTGPAVSDINRGLEIVHQEGGFMLTTEGAPSLL